MNAAELSVAMAANAKAIAQYLFPAGKKVGNEWKVGSASGEAGQSLSIRIAGHKAGVWADFATGSKGDLLDLWVAARGLSMADAMAEAKAYLGIRDSMPDRPRVEYRRPQRPECKRAVSRVRDWLMSRGLEERTINDFKIAEQKKGDKWYAIFPYLREGVLVNTKYRNPDEKKDMRQEGGAEPCLFGWHLIEPKTRVIAITEGEIDCMTLHQAGIPSLSVNAGANNHQWIDSDWDRLERFSEILICFDDDEQGNKGAQEVIRRLGIERCKRVKFPEKDANEYLIKGASGEDFWHYIKEAKSLDPDELSSAQKYIKAAEELFYPSSDKIKEPVLKLNVELPWFEFRRGELTIWTGYNNHGKSLMLSQVLLGLATQGERFCVFSGEMQPARQLKRMLKQASGLDRPAPEYIRAIGDWLSDKFWLFDHVGSAPLSRLLEVFLYANRRYAIGHFVIDSLMMTDVPEDGPGSQTAQKEAVQKMCDFARRNNIHLHLVAHPRKGVDEKNGPGKMDVAGSSKIVDGADNVFTVWSARKDQSQDIDDSPDGKLELQKCRNGEVVHYTEWLWFNRDSQQYTTRRDRRGYVIVDYSNQI